MHRRVAFGAIAYLALGLLAAAHAARIVHPTGGFSLDFPKGWVIEKKKSTFALTHSDGSSFEGELAQLPPNASLKVVALMARAAALAVGFWSKEARSMIVIGCCGWN